MSTRTSEAPAPAEKQVYAACPIKRRRSTKRELEEMKTELLGIVAEQKPMSVRQVFYQAVCRGLTDKSEAGYSRVQRALVQMRLEGMLPFTWIADYTRYRSKPTTYDSIDEAMEAAAAYYRRDLWTFAHAHVEIWCEKEALLGVIDPVTDKLDVSLMITKGFSSLTFLQASAMHLESVGRPCFIYQFGDHDPSGVSIANSVDTRLREFAPNTEIHFERVAITKAQIEAWNLPTRPTKRTDSRAKNWEGGSVELDALPPDTLRALVRDCIEQHVDPDLLRRLEVTEAAERETILGIAQQMRETRP